MSSPITVSIDGMSTVIGNLNSLSAALEAEIQGLLEGAGTGTYDDSQAVVPVSTTDAHSGELKESGHVDVEKLNVTVAYDANYAIDVECGTRHQSAEPFLFPPFEVRSQQLMNDLKALV